MSEDHPNIALLKRLDLGNVAGSADLFAEDVDLHYFNPLLPDIQGDYAGRSGIRAFFKTIAGLTEGTFKANPASVTPSQMNCWPFRPRTLLSWKTSR